MYAGFPFLILYVSTFAPWMLSWVTYGVSTVVRECEPKAGPTYPVLIRTSSAIERIISTRRASRLLLSPCECAVGTSSSITTSSLCRARRLAMERYLAFLIRPPRVEEDFPNGDSARTTALAPAVVLPMKDGMGTRFLFRCLPSTVGDAGDGRKAYASSSELIHINVPSTRSLMGYDDKIFEVYGAFVYILFNREHIVHKIVKGNYSDLDSS